MLHLYIIFLLVTIFLFEILTICYNCRKHRSKQKTYYHINSIKMARSDELILISKEINIKHCTYHYFSNMININEFNPNTKG